MLTVNLSLNEKILKEMERIQKKIGSGRKKAIRTAPRELTADEKQRGNMEVYYEE